MRKFLLLDFVSFIGSTMVAIATTTTISTGVTTLMVVQLVGLSTWFTANNTDVSSYVSGTGVVTFNLSPTSSGATTPTLYLISGIAYQGSTTANKIVTV
jgi:hypothetical protein